MYKRWYDKNPDLKDILNLIEKLDTDLQDKIAIDVMQILINDFNLDLDRKINEISKNYTYKCSRWYDKNINLFSAFEIIKNLPCQIQKEVINRISESIFLVYFDQQ